MGCIKVELKTELLVRTGEKNNEDDVVLFEFFLESLNYTYSSTVREKEMKRKQNHTHIKKKKKEKVGEVMNKNSLQRRKEPLSFPKIRFLSLWQL